MAVRLWENHPPLPCSIFRSFVEKPVRRHPSDKGVFYSLRIFPSRIAIAPLPPSLLLRPQLRKCINFEIDGARLGEGAAKKTKFVFEEKLTGCRIKARMIKEVVKSTV